MKTQTENIKSEKERSEEEKKVLDTARQILKKYQKAFKELAK